MLENSCKHLENVTEVQWTYNKSKWVWTHNAQYKQPDNSHVIK